MDNIDYLPERSLLYSAAAGAARLSVARLEESGILKQMAVRTTATGA